MMQEAQDIDRILSITDKLTNSNLSGSYHTAVRKRFGVSGDRILLIYRRRAWLNVFAFVAGAVVWLCTTTKSLQNLI
jgi:hypothetical protein